MKVKPLHYYISYIHCRYKTTMKQTSKMSSPSHTMMAKTLPLIQEDATNLGMAEDDAKIAINIAIGESFVTVQ